MTLKQMEEMDDENKWSELKGRLVDRTANINILGGLAVAASATFLVAQAPTDFADWNYQFPYAFVGIANASALLSVLSGLGLLIILNIMDLHSFQASMLSEMRERWLSYTFLFILLMMPLFFLVSASVAATIGWIWAIWFGDKLWMKIMACLVCAMCIFTALVLVGVLLRVAKALVAAGASSQEFKV
ncbi:hypothetical protein EV401DRAFT_2075305 [Pisolithus croceorrhizus]|nr:hypothetical protein EV401DRAFT_2075305 [Pisolithus croceorrhizus]